jgi:pyruvate carboxylase
MRDPVEDLLVGYKARAIAAAKSAGLPVLDSCEPSSNVDELHAAA